MACQTGIETLPTSHLGEFTSEWAMRQLAYPRLMGQTFPLGTPRTDKDPCVDI